MPNATQNDRMAVLATPLGKDVLLFSRMDGSEAIGELFEFRIEALSLTANINFDQALGRNCSVHLKTCVDVGRDFSGVLAEARWLSKRGDFYVYSLVLRPWPWLLSLTSDCRIFPNMNPRQIIKQVFEDRGFGDVLDLTVKDYPTLEYTVQYRETDLNFVLRLMEEYGIYFYFQFEPSGGNSPSSHYLVLANSTAHVRLPLLSEVRFQHSYVGARRDTQQFNEWNKSHAIVSGVFALNDYNYESPNSTLLAPSQYCYEYEHGAMEIYDYPGDYMHQDEGLELAAVSRDVERTRNLRCSASGYAPSLTPGYTINRTSSDENDSENGDYLLLRCVHAYGDQFYQSSHSSQVCEADYYGAYELAKSDIPYRMPQRTRAPAVLGTQSALVIGQKGEEIDVDEFGRVLVQFYWDRKKKPSRRVRVGQFWAGSHRGALFTPRIGDEVLVQYEEGDPDRPIVVGSVYNGTNTVPAHLPGKKNNSGILTRSTKDSQGYHMLLFDDTKGQEKIKLRSQRDLMFKALGDETRVIGGGQTETVGGDETISVGGPKGGGNFTLNAFQTITLNVGPSGSPLTQIVMDTTSITLSVGPGGALAQIKMDPSGVTISGTPASQLMVQPSGITTVTPTLNFTMGPVTFVSPLVDIPVLNIGVGTIGLTAPIL